MATPERDQIRWGDSGTKSISDFPHDLAEALDAVLPGLRGYARRVFIGLASIYVDESCPDEARDVLLDWVEQAHRDEATRHPNGIARAFAEAVIEHGEPPARD